MRIQLYKWRALLVVGALLLSSSLSAQPQAVSAAAQALRSTVEPGRLGETVSREATEGGGMVYGGMVNMPQGRVFSEEESKITFQLNGIRIKNAVVFTSEELVEPFQEFFGQKITLGELQQMAQCMTKRYQQAGYVLTQVIIPEQKLENGMVIFEVIPGYIDKVEILACVDPELMAILQCYGEHIRASYPLNIEVLERYTLLSNDIPGLKVNAVLKRSETTLGAADVVFIPEFRQESALLSTNNYGTRFIGPQEYIMGLDEHSFFRAGDFTQLQVVTTANQEMNFAQVRHTELLDDDGMRWGAMGRFVRTEPGSILEPLESKGKSRFAGTDLFYPIIRSKKLDLSLLTGFMIIDSKAELLGAPLYADRIRPIFGTLIYKGQDSYKGFNQAELTLTQGLEILDASGASNVSRPGAQSFFTKVNGVIARDQKLRDNVSVAVTVFGQYSFQSLMAITQFGFGGPELGRGYDPSEILGDKGIAGSVEFRYNGVSDSKIVPFAQSYIFYDVGKVWHTDPIITHDSAASTGIGIRLQILTHGRANFFIAKPLTRRVLATNNRNIRGFFSLSIINF